MHINARSLLPIWEEINETFLNCSLDVVAITESWLHVNVQDSLVSRADYDLFRLDRQVCNANGSVKKGGGICIYSKKNDIVENKSMYNFSDNDIELLHVCIKKGFNQRVNVICVYRPPSGSWLKAIEELDSCIKWVKNNCKGEIVMLGDLNIDLDSVNNNRNAASLNNFAEGNSLKQLIDSPTRVTVTSSSRIDLIFTDIESVSKSGTIDSYLSHHFPVFLVKKKPTITKDLITITCRAKKDMVRDDFKSNMENFEFPNSDFPDPNDLWGLLWKHIRNTCDKHCPFVTFKAKPKVDFINDTILAKMKICDRASKLARQTKIPEEINHAKALRQEVTRLLRQAKRKFILEQLNVAKGLFGVLLTMRL